MWQAWKQFRLEKFYANLHLPLTDLNLNVKIWSRQNSQVTGLSRLSHWQTFWRLLSLSAVLLRKLNIYYYLCNALGTECQETYFPSTFSLSKRSSLGTSCYLCRTVLNWVLLILGRILCKCKKCTAVCCYCRIHSVVWRSKCILWCPFVRLPWGS